MLDGGTAENRAASPQGDAAPSPSADPARDPAPPVDRSAPFVSNDGRTIRVSASLEPVFELKGFTRIGFRMIRRVIVITHRGEEELSPQQVGLLPTADLLRIDLATIARGVSRLQSESERQLSLIVPMSFTSLSTLKGRTELVQALKEAGALVRLGVICEIGDIDGVPQTALLAATSVVKPVSLLVVGRLTAPTSSNITRLDGAGLQALSFDCPEGLSDPEFQAWATQTLGVSKRIARAALIYRASSPKRAGLLSTLGATHVSLADR